jgi:nucleotide-binding universal stress UspA family protein
VNVVPSDSVVVGLDRSSGSKVAVDWAAGEARLRGVPLRIAHSWSTAGRDLPPESVESGPEPAYRAAAAFVDEAAADVRARYSGLDVGTVLLSEAAAEGLIHLAEHAGLLAVGRRGLNSFIGLLMGSVSQRLVAHAPVPVVVVPEIQLPSAAPGSVVVGVARGVPAPVAFAFREAELRGVPLLAVRAWSSPTERARAFTEGAGPVEEQENAELQALLAEARRAHPSVAVTTRITSGTAEEALVVAAEKAALVVVGRHRRHLRYGLPLGVVAHRVLHLANAPVAVVPD